MRSRIGLAGNSLAARTFLASAAVLVCVFVALVLTPVEVSAPIRTGQAAILLGGLTAMLVIQLILVRRVLAPLRELAAQMEAVDLRDPGPRLPERSNDGEEITTFVGAFNGMLDRLADQRRQSAAAVLSAQEAERGRAARELHDEVGQTLTAVALQVERLIDDADPVRAARLAELAEQLHGTLAQIRRIVRRLRPEALDDLGLVNALIALISRLSRLTDTRIERKLEGAVPPLDSNQELVIYRIAQESLTNIVRHAEATTASVSLRQIEDQLILTVTDNGRGMPNGPVPTIGIEGMRERALLVGATLTIDSQPAGGTKVQLVLPLQAP